MARRKGLFAHLRNQQPAGGTIFRAGPHTRMLKHNQDENIHGEDPQEILLYFKPQQQIFVVYSGAPRRDFLMSYRVARPDFDVNSTV